MPSDSLGQSGDTCEKCGTQPVSLNVRQNENGEIRQYRLCEKCAAHLMPPMAPLVDLLLSVGMDGVLEPPTPRMPACAGCGLTLERLKERRRLGCDRCYAHFAEALGTMVRDIQPTDRHAGKIPARNRVRIEVTALEQALRKAITAQEFERAAELRDQIRALRSPQEAVAQGDRS